MRSHIQNEEAPLTTHQQTELALREAKEIAEARAAQLDILNQVMVLVNSSLDLPSILQNICQVMVEIFKSRNAGIALLTPDKNNLRVAAFRSTDPNEPDATNMLLPLEGNLASQHVLKTSKTIVIADAQTSTLTTGMHDVMRARGTHSLMIVPLMTRGEVIGTIGLPAERSFTAEDTALAETIAGQIASAVENARLYAEVEKAKNVAERDLDIGQQIQAGFFPQELPMAAGWEIAAHFQAARQVAGDFYDAFPLGTTGRRLALVIGDVCDKGVGAALFMALFRSLIRAFADERYSGTHPDQPLRNLRNTVTLTNNYIANTHGRANMFATLFYGMLDTVTGILHYINGGQDAPIIVNAAGELKTRLEPTAPAVGMLADLEFPTAKAQLDPGDVFVAFTDGVTDARNPAGELFDEERLLVEVQRPVASADRLMTRITGQLREFIATAPQYDDVTVLIVRRSKVEDGQRLVIDQRAPNEFRATLGAQLENLNALREFIGDVCQRTHVGDEIAFVLKLAVDETCTNIIQHGYAHSRGGSITIEFSRQSDRVVIHLIDHGTPFDPMSAAKIDPAASIDQRPTGGLGIFFIKETMDEINYASDPINGNRLTLIKSIKHSGA
jgi:serine phosphatase RsbU (regulator of sigma subunit)/anti-sigma regulatory factor (Ser/Thr protein kinase)